MDWHAISAADVLRRLGSSQELGLDDEEAAKRLEQHGPNELAEVPPPSFVRRVGAQLKNPLTALLLLAALLAALVAEAREAIGIALVVSINALVGAVLEQRADRDLAALRDRMAQQVRVLRNGRQMLVLARELVPGDIVHIEAGDRLAADGRLLEAAELDVDEATLTGESLPVTKSAAPVEQRAELGDRKNLVFSHTMVTRGRGRLVVTATGGQTETGRLATAVAEAEDPPTPLMRELGRLGRRLGALVVVLCVVLLVSMVLRGESWTSAALVAVAMAAAAIPEGLPAVVTLTLALGVSRMAKKRALVRRLTSVEGLGATTVICTDKTGTLTQNRMAARVVVSADGETLDVEPDAPDLAPLALGLVLCNDADAEAGDPTEIALVEMASTLGIDVEAARAAHPRVAELPFSSESRLMATAHRDGTMWLKGAPDTVLDRCAMSSETRAKLDEVAERLSAQGLRMLACARGNLERDVLEKLPSTSETNDDDAHQHLRRHLEELELVGLVGLLDPVRDEAKDATARARGAGMRLIVITGDHPGTAGRVAQELGIEGRATPAANLRALDDESLARELADVAVVARVAPEDKAQLVRALQHRGEVVAMCGDGVNDAIALAAADVGVAMGRTGSDVAKEAADLVLTDDNLGTVVKAVAEGRTIYANILRFLSFQLSTSTGALLVVFLAPWVLTSSTSMGAALTATQLLFINLVMDGPPALALGSAPPAGDELDQPPRPPHQSMLTWSRLAAVALVGGIVATLTLLVTWQASQRGMSADEVRTTTFVTFVLLQCAGVLAFRGSGSIFRTLTSHRALGLGIASVVVLCAVCVYIPAGQALLGTVHPPTWTVLAAAAAALALFAADQTRRVLTSFFSTSLFSTSLFSTSLFSKRRTP